MVANPRQVVRRVDVQHTAGVVHVDPGTTPLLYTSRAAAALLGALGVAALYAAGKRVYGPAAGLLMASILAFQPTTGGAATMKRSAA